MSKKSFRSSPSRLLTAIDIGSSKVSCLIAEVKGEDTPPLILGLGNAPISKTKFGFSPNMESTEEAIINAVHKAEKEAKVTVKHAVLSVSSPDLLSEIIKVTVSIAGPAVTEADIQRILNKALTSNSKEFSVVHVNPIKFSVDQGPATLNPKGLHGQKLTAFLHVVTGSLSTMRNLVNCLRRCHIHVKSILPAAIASGLSTLGEDEREMGVTVIDMGSQSTDMAVFMDGAVVYTARVPLGSAHITSDLAQGLSTSLPIAERIKLMHGSALETNEDRHTLVDVDQMNGSQSHVKRSLVTTIITARAEEIFALAHKELSKNPLKKSSGRHVVLTGGGSQLQGIKECAHRILGKQVRLGKPLNFMDSSTPYTFPHFSTCTGLLTFAMGQNYSEVEQSRRPWVQALVNWLKDNF